MFPTKRSLRVLFALLVVVPTALLGVAHADRIVGGPDTPRTEETGDARKLAVSSVPSESITVVTNHFDSAKHGSIAAFAENGTLIYRNRTHNRYFDVDPVPGTTHSVMYVGSDVLDNSYCKLPKTAQFNCIRNVVERLNLSTGEVERRYTYDVSTRHPEDSIHDVDRLNDTHLLVADIFENRVFIVNSSSELITWSWHASTAYDFEGGGSFRDWTHLNDVEYIESRDLVMTDPRNHDQVLFIDRKTGLRENLTLGSDGNHDVLYEQHNPDYIPEPRGGPAVLIADSENNRIVEYQRAGDEWNQSWVWSDARMQWPRDADRLPNGNTLVTDTHSNRVFEVNESGAITWQIDYPKPYEAERLGTGDESAGGESAASLGLDSKRAGDATATTGGGGVQQSLYVALKTLVPNRVFHGLKWVLPSWVSLTDMLALAVALLSALAWFASELYWTDRVRFRSPIAVRRR